MDARNLCRRKRTRKYNFFNCWVVRVVYVGCVWLVGVDDVRSLGRTSTRAHVITPSQDVTKCSETVANINKIR